mgnify:CR=1 FL=1
MLILTASFNLTLTYLSLTLSIFPTNPDEVMTSSGLVGKIESVKDRYVSVRLNDAVKINMQKEFVSSKLPKGTINSIEAQ